MLQGNSVLGSTRDGCCSERALLELGFHITEAVIQLCLSKVQCVFVSGCLSLLCSACSVR